MPICVHIRSSMVIFVLLILMAAVGLFSIHRLVKAIKWDVRLLSIFVGRKCKNELNSLFKRIMKLIWKSASFLPIGRLMVLLSGTELGRRPRAVSVVKIKLKILVILRFFNLRYGRNEVNSSGRC